MLEQRYSLGSSGDEVFYQRPQVGQVGTDCGIDMTGGIAIMGIDGPAAPKGWQLQRHPPLAGASTPPYPGITPAENAPGKAAPAAGEPGS